MDYIFPLKQHVGAPASAVVKAGDSVTRGQLIAAKEEGTLGANIYTSVSGTVSNVDDEKIIIAEQGTEFDSYIPLKGTGVKELIEEAGIVGLGGAGFPTAVKLNTRFEKGGTVIINAAECEPILSHNIARIEKESDKLLEGLKIVMNLVNAEKGIIAIKSAHKEAIEDLKEAIKENNITVFPLDNIYPMGEERAVIRETLGILLEPEQLSMAADAIVINAETTFKIREAVEEKKPLIDKDMTVAGKLAENASI